tara:strand:- start:744 stop:1022 length:279 start_codon:yes stop_codon:yes gene_type:complete
MSNTFLKNLRTFIKEEIGRNYHTVDDSSYTFADEDGYDIQIDGTDERGFFLTVYHDREKLTPSQRYNSHDDAYHAARMIIEKDKVRKFNSSI